MPPNSKKVPLPTSEVIHPPGARPGRKVRGSQGIRVTLVLKTAALRSGHPTAKKVKRILSARSHRRPALSERELAEYQRADAAHVEAVRQFAAAHGLEVTQVSQARRDVVLEGTAKALCEAFDVDLRHYAQECGAYRAHPEGIRVPVKLREAVEGVMGLDNLRLVNRPHAAKVAPHRPDSTCLSALALAEYYRFPRDTTGHGQRIAIIEFGGGYHSSDIEAHLQKSGISRPGIRNICIPGDADDAPTRNDPLDCKSIRTIIRAMKTNPDRARRDFAIQLPALRDTVEVTMDLEIASALAPGAEFAMIFAPGNGQGLYDALNRAVAEDASVISLSWGFVECAVPEHQLRAINRVLRDACLQGITVCCASGDDGSRATGEERSNGLANVNFPASSPYALACGGTALCRTNDRIEGEIVWNQKKHDVRLASGGGVSGWFAAPAYQHRVSIPRIAGSASKKTWLSSGNAGRTRYRGRGVPDVAANAALDSGYKIVVGGVDYHGFGTSAAAPLWAALIARLNEGLGHRLGWANRDIYHSDVAHAFRAIKEGDNDVCDGKVAYYRARGRWSACTGLGTPDGVRLLLALRLRH